MVLVVAFVVFVFVVVIASLAVAVPGVPVCLAARQLPTQAVRSGLMMVMIKLMMVMTR